jgi:hypothetical protein
VSNDAEKKSGPKVVTPADVTDERLLVGQLRALQRDMKAGFDHMDVRYEQTSNRIINAVDDLVARVTVLERRVNQLEDKPRRVAGRKK